MVAKKTESKARESASADAAAGPAPTESKETKSAKAKAATSKSGQPTKKQAKAGSKSAGADRAGKNGGNPTTRDFAVLLSPVITEKSSLVGTQSASGSKTFVFRVDRRSDKDQIRAAVEKIFKVNVLKVRTVNCLGKIKRTNRSIGRRAASKKAYVTLKEGQSISVVEGL